MSNKKFYDRLKQILKKSRLFPILLAVKNRFVSLRNLFSFKSNHKKIKKITVDGFNIYIRENTSDIAVVKHSFSNDIYIDFLQTRIEFSEISLVLDIGAYIGTFALNLNQLISRESIIHCFEPSIGSYELLVKNLNNNDVKNVLTHNKAIYDSVGSKKIYTPISGHWGTSFFTKSLFNSEKVITTDLETFLSEEKIAKVDLVRMNIEGSEFKIMGSIANTTLIKIDRFLILYHLDLNSKFKLEDITSKLINNNFHVEILNESRYRGWIYAKKI
jgi:FkbM family methyltransferase